jgi:F0F1-type ATP synthase beta subunit
VTAMQTGQAAEGRIQQVFGPVVDVEFPEGHLPKIYNSIRVQDAAKGIDLKVFETGIKVIDLLCPYVEGRQDRPVRRRRRRQDRAHHRR